MSGTEDHRNVHSSLMHYFFSFDCKHILDMLMSSGRSKQSEKYFLHMQSFSVSDIIKEGVGQAGWLGSKNTTSVEGSSETSGLHKLEFPGHISCPHQYFTHFQCLSKFLGFLCPGTTDIYILKVPAFFFFFFFRFSFFVFLFSFFSSQEKERKKREGKWNSGKGNGRKGMLLSLPDDKFGCNERMNLGPRRWQLKTTTLVSVKLNTSLCLFCK